jgi:hypothetical protein
MADPLEVLPRWPLRAGQVPDDHSLSGPRREQRPIRGKGNGVHHV